MANISEFTLMGVDDAPQDTAHNSTVRLFAYNGIRCVQCVTGVVGNALTLVIIGNLKHTAHGHVLMAYLAVSDMAVCCVAPLAFLTAATRLLPSSEGYWNSLCIVKEYFYDLAMIACCITYVVASADR